MSNLPDDFQRQAPGSPCYVEPASDRAERAQEDRDVAVRDCYAAAEALALLFDRHPGDTDADADPADLTAIAAKLRALHHEALSLIGEPRQWVPMQGGGGFFKANS